MSASEDKNLYEIFDISEVTVNGWIEKNLEKNLSLASYAEIVSIDDFQKYQNSIKKVEAHFKLLEKDLILCFF